MPRGSPASARSAGSSNAAILASFETVAGSCRLPSMLERARQKDGRQVVPVDVDRDDVAYLGRLLEGLSRESIGRALDLLLRECQRRGVRR
jgi:hypothetical protein